MLFGNLSAESHLLLVVIVIKYSHAGALVDQRNDLIEIHIFVYLLNFDRLIVVEKQPWLVRIVILQENRLNDRWLNPQNIWQLRQNDLWLHLCLDR